MSEEILKAIKQICDEKNITEQSVIETIEAALAVAFRKDFGEKNQNIKVEFSPETAQSRVFDVKTVVEDVSEAELEKAREEMEKEQEVRREDRAAGKVKTVPVEESEEDKEKKKLFNPKTDIMISEAKKMNKDVSLGDDIRTELFPPAAYGRMAAQTAKQVIIQKLREAERDVVYHDYKEREGEIISGVVQRVEGRMVLVDIGQTTAIMPPQEQIERENYLSGQRVKVYIVAVTKTTKGPEIVVSRSHPEMVKKLFFMEVPEISAGAIEIKAVAREAGSRSKIAVRSKESNIDPVGSCVGQRGTRVQTVIAELGGEKIDIIEYDEDSVRFIMNALSPAKVLSVKLNEEERRAVAEVKEDQLSLAIGKSGQNVRLSAKLTGWKIDIIPEGGKEHNKEAAKAEVSETNEEVKETVPKVEETTQEEKKPEVATPAEKSGEKDAEPVKEPESEKAKEDNTSAEKPKEAKKKKEKKPKEK